VEMGVFPGTSLNWGTLKKARKNGGERGETHNKISFLKKGSGECGEEALRRPGRKSLGLEKKYRMEGTYRKIGREALKVIGYGTASGSSKQGKIKGPWS